MNAVSDALTPLEIAVGFVIGLDRTAPPLPSAPPGLTPRRAFEQAVLSALRRPPCLVSFSGGRDSSAVLAVAVHVARREGLPLPIPISLRFPGVPEMVEDGWQERVVRYLGLSDWEQLEPEGDQLDFIGPVAANLMRRHGLLSPALSHMFFPPLERAGGGSLLTGLEGDSVLGQWHWQRLTDVLARRAKAQPRDLLRTVKAVAPVAVRRRVALWRGLEKLPWLRAATQRDFERAWVAEAEAEPVWWNARIAWAARQRFSIHFRATIAEFARDTDTLVVHPMLDSHFLSALGRAGGLLGWGDRAAVLGMFVGDLLPADVLTRKTKANFATVFWRGPSRRFRERWDGRGVDLRLVDETALRAEWSKAAPSLFSVTLLRRAWLAADNARRGNLERSERIAGHGLRDDAGAASTPPLDGLGMGDH